MGDGGGWKAGNVLKQHWELTEVVEQSGTPSSTRRRGAARTPFN